MTTRKSKAQEVETTPEAEKQHETLPKFESKAEHGTPQWAQEYADWALKINEGAAKD